MDFTYFRRFQGFVHNNLSLFLGAPFVLLVSLVAAVAAAQRPLASDAVRLKGLLQSQPVPEGGKAGVGFGWS